MRRFLVMFALVALAATSAVPVSARQPSGTIGVTPLTAKSLANGAKTQSGRLAQSDPELLGRNDSQIVNIMVKLDADAVASYTGGVNGLRATSPSATGKTLKDNSSAVAAYKTYLNLKATGVRRAAQRAVPNINLGRNFLVAYGGFSARMPANKARELARVPGVAAVQYDAVNHPDANDSPNFVGANQVWPSLGGESKAGKGVKVGVLDTGIWPEHPMFADPGIPNPGGGPYDCDFGLSGDTYDDPFVCNDKLIGAYAFLDTNLAVGGPDTDEYCTSASTCSARDADGHGTHTTSTAAGSPVDHAVLFGVDRGHISGIAPGASVIMYRVCDADGCYSSDSVAAVEQAIDDDVDVINFSISGGSSAYTDAVELAFLDAYAAAILVNASAGNDGPGAGTANHAGPWTNTVGASTLDRQFKSTLYLTATGGPGPLTLTIDGATVTDGITSPTDVVLAEDPPYSDSLCTAEAGSGSFAGKVVVCRRGAIARVEKGYNVLQGGAAGMILYNTTQTDVETDNHFLPAIHLNDPTSSIVAFVHAHSGVKATWAQGTAAPAQGDVMASFSSRGPLGDFIKPDVTAPGVQILAGASPHHLDDPAEGLGPQGELYQAIAGTSMSSPHAAGVAALVRAAHPDWTVGQIKSALMTSSLQSVLKEDGSTPTNPFDRGAGSIRANRAVNPTVTFDVSPVDYYASASDPLGRIDLNLPSVNAPDMDGIVSTMRYARNVSGTTQTLNISASSHITVSPRTLTIPPGYTKGFEITIHAAAQADGQYFGQVTLNPQKAGANNAVLPVAWNKQPGKVTLSNSCDSGTVAKGSEVGCEVTVTNYASETANVSVRLKSKAPSLVNLNDWSAGFSRPMGFQWNGTLDPALPPEILGLTTPGYGYLGLKNLGVPAESGYGDETIGNYDGFSAPVVFGGEEYDTVALDSNGYLVLGGGTAEDNNCCDPSLPDPAQPNNVLAPYWTDLNPGAGGEIRVAELNFGGGFVYMVFEWRKVPVYGTTDERTFQVWLGEASGGEDTAFEYCVTPNDNPYGSSEDGCNNSPASLLGPGSSDGLIVGAENRDGSSGATIGPIDTQPVEAGYVVHAGTPLAGGTMTITYDAKGAQRGSTKITAVMTSDVTQGRAKKVTPIKVVH